MSLCNAAILLLIASVESRFQYPISEHENQ